MRSRDKFAENDGISLSNDGLPQKGGQLSASQAYKWLAEQADVQAAIDALHQTLKEENNIWLWKKGAIEAHLGLAAKNEHTWATFKKRLNDEGFEAVITDQGVIDMLNWIIE